MKKISALFLMLLTAIFVLSACGTAKDDNAKKDDKNTGSTEGDLLAKVQENGELLVGTEGTYPPFTYHEKSTHSHCSCEMATIYE